MPILTAGRAPRWLSAGLALVLALLLVGACNDDEGWGTVLKPSKISSRR